ncbi:MAG: DNA internalization-related competence protein ComEC/Rec2 [Gammaproteobacteria bacterium]
MHIYAPAFLCGMLLLLPLESLPSHDWLLLLVPLALVSLWKRFGIAFAVIAGFCYAWLDAASYLDRMLPAALERTDLLVEGCVIGLPARSGDAARFVFGVEAMQDGAGRAIPFAGRIRLSWYAHEQALHPGDCGRLSVRLFQPRGFRNPGAMDYERWLFQQDLLARGYVRESTANRLEASGDLSADAFRDRLRAQVLALDSPAATPVYLALLIGDRSLLDDASWQLFRQTGTSHLVAISGLHIGLVAMLAWWLCERLWRYAGSMPLRVPSPVAAACCAMIAAFLYAAMAGFAIPTQRALMMTLVVVAAVLARRNSGGLQALGVALIAVLVLDPGSIHSAGFWLSFAAVTSILLMIRRYPALRSWRLLIAIQLGLSLLLVPVLATWHFPVSPLAPFVNLVAVPWFSFVIVPGVLLSAIFLQTGLPGHEWLPEAVMFLIDLTLAALERAASPGWLVALPELPLATLIGSMAGGALLLLGKGWRMRLAGMPLLALLLWPVPQDELRVTILDVGQGISVVAESGGRVLVYDLGPIYPGGFNTAEAVVMPFLAARGISDVDMLVISHDDSDHSGGYERFLEEIPTGVRLSGQPGEFAEDFRHCHEQPAWKWQHARFAFLPVRLDDASDNDLSCVLLIEHPSASILITGDITRRAEQALLEQYPHIGNIDLVTMPHHGSRSSSSQEFVKRLQAGDVVATAGWKNHFGHPKPDVVERWVSTGATVHETAAQGALTFAVNSGEANRLDGYRFTDRHFWHR